MVSARVGAVSLTPTSSVDLTLLLVDARAPNSTEKAAPRHLRERSLQLYLLVISLMISPKGRQETTLDSETSRHHFYYLLVAARAPATTPQLRDLHGL